MWDWLRKPVIHTLWPTETTGVGQPACSAGTGEPDGHCRASSHSSLGTSALYSAVHVASHSESWDSGAFAHIRKALLCGPWFNWTQLDQAATQQLCVVERMLSSRNCEVTQLSQKPQAHEELLRYFGETTSICWSQASDQRHFPSWRGQDALYLFGNNIWCILKNVYIFK